MCLPTLLHRRVYPLIVYFPFQVYLCPTVPYRYRYLPRQPSPLDLVTQRPPSARHCYQVRPRVLGPYNYTKSTYDCIFNFIWSTQPSAFLFMVDLVSFVKTPVKARKLDSWILFAVSLVERFYSSKKPLSLPNVWSYVHDTVWCPEGSPNPVPLRKFLSLPLRYIRQNFVSTNEVDEQRPRPQTSNHHDRQRSSVRSTITEGCQGQWPYPHTPEMDVPEGRGKTIPNRIHRDKTMSVESVSYTKSYSLVIPVLRRHKS